MKLGKKTRLKTIEEMPLEELECQIRDEGQFIMVPSMLLTDNRDKMCLWRGSYHINHMLDLHNVKYNFVKFFSFSGNRTNYSRMVFQIDDCDWAWKDWVSIKKV